LRRRAAGPLRIVRALAAPALLIVLPAAAIAQEDWFDYVNRDDRFGVSFPGQPMVKEIGYQPERGKPLPARVYSAERGRERYSVTVVDYATAGINDVPGAIAWEAWNFRKRGGQVTQDTFANVDRIPGHELHITTADGSRTFAQIHLHRRKLYILEADIPANMPTPGAVLFIQSLSILDEEGRRIRYELDQDGNRTDKRVR
jgi:hypothetical protein